MAYTKLISAPEVVAEAMRILEAPAQGELSLRAIATALGVKAPSLYRYFAQKEALEVAVAEEALRAMLAAMGSVPAGGDAQRRFRAMAEAYLQFARQRFALYMFVMDRVPQTYGSVVGKQVWNVLLEAASNVSGRPDDTAAAVATWSFLHGFAVLEHAGGFGASGPKGGLELGLAAFLQSFPREGGASPHDVAPSKKGGKRKR